MDSPGGGGWDAMNSEQQTVYALAADIADLVSRPWTLMEVCGTHTMNIRQYGLQSLLPSQVRLVSGPGCPVCVTDSTLLSAALAIAARPEVIFTSFGDMLRVPVGGHSLQHGRDLGWDIRTLFSPLEALTLAGREPKREIVFFAVGFETTAPLTASMLQLARKQGIDNLSVISGHKTMPNALRLLFTQNPSIDGLLCPGHVATVTGPEVFAFLPCELHKPAAVAGFGAAEIMRGIYSLLLMAEQGRADLVNCYPRAVHPGGNPKAHAVQAEVFRPADAIWRGLGLIQGSGLVLSEEYMKFDALSRFADCIKNGENLANNDGCRCSEVLRGELVPELCPLFGSVCDPEHPVGACMVSQEGSCAAAFRYRGVKQNGKKEAWQ